MEKEFTIGLIINNAFLSIEKYFKYYASLTIIMVVLNFGIYYALDKIIETGGENTSIFASLFALLLVLIAYIKMAIMIHRSVLLEESNLSKIFSWSVIEFKFIGWGIGLYILVFAPIGILLAYIAPIFHEGKSSSTFLAIITPVLVIIALVIFSRLSLIFPATAMGKKATLADTWALSKSNKWLLFVLLVLVPALTNKIISLIPEEGWWLPLNLLVTVVFVIFEITILSHCFHRLMENYQAANNEDNSGAIEEIEEID